MASMIRNELMLRTMEDDFASIERACQEHLRELDLDLAREEAVRARRWWPRRHDPAIITASRSEQATRQSGQ